ncbi:MAG: hypothetical protein ACRDIF_04075 [Actinomycetota bacterium]
MSIHGRFRPRLTLEERVEALDAKKRDCRDCKMFTPSPTGLGFGWCSAFVQYVKLYHPSGGFFSQCQFKMLSRASPEEAEEEATG